MNNLLSFPRNQKDLSLHEGFIVLVTVMISFSTVFYFIVLFRLKALSHHSRFTLHSFHS